MLQHTPNNLHVDAGSLKIMKPLESDTRLLRVMCTTLVGQGS